MPEILRLVARSADQPSVTRWPVTVSVGEALKDAITGGAWGAFPAPPPHAATVATLTASTLRIHWRVNLFKRGDNWFLRGAQVGCVGSRSTIQMLVKPPSSRQRDRARAECRRVHQATEKVSICAQYTRRESSALST